MKTKQLLSVIAFAAAGAVSTVSMAQVKIGSNPTTITPGANLDIEGQNSTHSVVMQSGHVGINHSNPPTTLHVQAVSNVDLPSATNVVARFDPMGGSNISSAASIAINAGRAVVGYAIDPEQNKYAFLRSNASTDLRLQVTDESVVLQENPFVMLSTGASKGFIGLNTEVPQARLDVRGNIKALPIVGTQTGLVWNGTSNIDGFEAYTTAGGDAWVGIQRKAGAPLHLSKPTGFTESSFAIFSVEGQSAVGSIKYNGASGVVYNTTSDQRLKENIHATKFGLEALKTVKVYDYNFKADSKKTLSTGVLAQELHKVFPQAVTVGGADVKNNPWQVDYSKLVPMLVKSVQELNDKVEALEKGKVQMSAELTQKAASIAELNERVSQIEKALDSTSNSKSISR